MDNLSSWKEQFKKRPLFGCFVTFDSPDIAEFTAKLGFDFILVDNEHGVMEQSTVVNMVRAAQCQGVPALVRCTENTRFHVQKALDFGANGIQMPMINTVEDAKNVVRLSNYPPEGERGTAYLPRASAYGLCGDKTAYLKKANETKLISVQIETVEAIKNLDDILEVEGVDVYFVGPGDLSSSMGLPPGHHEVQEATKNIIQKVVSRDKIAGVYVGTAEATRQAIEWGARFLLTAITPYMAVGAKKYLNDVKSLI